VRAERLEANPIITPEQDPGIGDNINGPSLIRVPDWVERPLGRYYLYFAHHEGDYIRLAYADRLEGPWSIHGPGTLHLEESTCVDHIASPDVHVDEERRQIRMYFHGYEYCDPDVRDPHRNPMDVARPWVQRSKLALSSDGLSFAARAEVLGPSYFRVFRHRDWHYALAMPGLLYRSKDGVSGFERGPALFGLNARHSAVLIRDETLHVFFSNAGDCPERILKATVDLRQAWTEWSASESVTVLEPEAEYEGGDLPLEPSQRGLASTPVRQLRDPAIFEEGAELFLLYSVAGERGLAIAQLLPAEGRSKR